MYIAPFFTFISSLSLNHHLYTDDTQPFLSFRPISTTKSLTYETLYNRPLPGLPIFFLSTLLKLKFFLSDLNNNFLRYTTPLLLQCTPLGSPRLYFWRTFLTNFLPSLTKFMHFLNLATPWTSLYLPVPWLQNSQHHCNLHCTSIVHSKLAYCNSPYHNLPKRQLNRLDQQIQNFLARTVKAAFHYSSQLQTWSKACRKPAANLLKTVYFLHSIC